MMNIFYTINYTINDLKVFTVEIKEKDEALKFYENKVNQKNVTECLIFENTINLLNIYIKD